MSTRWYPLYKGAPQLRIFLPNFWLKVIKPTNATPKNTVTFECSMEMTKFDIQNYLIKIYNLPVIYVRTRIEEGKYRVLKDKRVKDDDRKIAYAVLDKSVEFEFPDVIGAWKVEKDKKKKQVVELTKYDVSGAKNDTQNWFTNTKYP